MREGVITKDYLVIATVEIHQPAISDPDFDQPFSGGGQEVAKGDPRMCGALVEVDPHTGKALSIERVVITGRVQPGGAYDADDGRGHKTHKT